VGGGSSQLVGSWIAGGAFVVFLGLLMRVNFQTDKTRVAQVREVTAENDGMRQKVVDLGARLDETRGQLREALAAASTAETHVINLNVEIKYLRESIGRLEAEIRTLRSGDVNG